MTKTVEQEDQQQRAFIEGLSYHDLLEHFYVASPENRFHRGKWGKFFSDTMNNRRAEIGDEEAKQIEAAILAKHKVNISATKH